ncbi:MAG: sugar ABC transporter substrate-binding protein [Desulfobacterales bacterium]|nr:MAG: sugar ABC transporter substrate-binding protein [Desulfobacterales bacterium]
MKKRMIFAMATFWLAAVLALLGVTSTNAGEVVLNVWTAFPELNEQVEWIAAKYMEKHPDIKIKATLFPQRALEEKVAVALPAGQAADLIELDKMGLYPYYVAGYLEPLPENLVAWLKDSYPDYAVTSVTADDGRIFTFPWLNSLKVMFYNKDHFKEAGITKTPDTIDEMLEMAKKLTKRDAKGNITQVGLDLRLSGGGFGTSQKYWCQTMIPYGAKVLEKVGDKWRAAYNNDAGRQALQFYVDAVHKYKVDSLDFKSDAEAFGLGLTSMFQREAWVVGYMAKNAPSINYGVFFMPKGPGGWGTVGNTMGLSVPKSSQYKKEAFDFAMFMMNDDMSRATFSDSGWQPFRQGVDYSELYKTRPQLATFIEAAQTEGHAVLDYENIAPIFEIHSRMADRLMAAFKQADLVDNPDGIAEVVEDMAKETNRILDEYDLLAQ